MTIPDDVYARLYGCSPAAHVVAMAIYNRPSATYQEVQVEVALCANTFYRARAELCRRGILKRTKKGWRVTT
jgi:predicted DNA-binding transcriptional regulator